MILFGKTVFTYSVVTQRDCFDFTMVNTETNGIRHYEVSKVYNQLDKIVSSLMCDGVYWCTYNGRYRDETILNYCIINYNDLKDKPIGDITFLIDSFAELVRTSPVQNWVNYKHAYKFKSFDLAPLFYNRGYVGLNDAIFKQFGEVYNGCVIPKGCFSDRRAFSREMSKLNSLYYHRLAEAKIKDILFRELLENEYSMHAMNDNITTIGLKLFRILYGVKAEYSPVDNRYSSIRLGDLIPKDYSFKFAGNNAFLEELRNITIDKDYVLSAVLPGRIATLTSGGLKGFLRKGVFNNNDKHIYYVDFKSAWPTMCVNFHIVPDKMSIEAFLFAINTMLTLKEDTSCGKNFREQFKVAVNSFIGSLMAENSEVHDFKAFMAIKIMSALETISLIEAIGNADILQVNNDGIVFMSDKPKNSMLLELGEWEDKHNIRLNFKEYKLFCQYSINDWFAVDSNSKIISSGFFEYGSTKYPLASALAVKMAITDDNTVDNMLRLIDNEKFIIRKSAGDGKVFAIKKEGLFETLANNVAYTQIRNGDSLFVRNTDMSEPKLVANGVKIGKATYGEIDTMWYIQKAYSLYSELTVTQQELF